MSNETPDAARVDALGYVEQTMYANVGNPRPLAWRNDEVMELLSEIAERLRVDEEECPACDTSIADCGGPDAACCVDCGHRDCWPSDHMIGAE